MDKVTTINKLKTLCEGIECSGVVYSKEGNASYTAEKHKPKQVIPREESTNLEPANSRRYLGISISDWHFQIKLQFQKVEIDQTAIIETFDPVPRMKIVDTIYHVLLTRIEFEHPTTQNRSRGSSVTLNVTVKPITK